MMIIENLKKEHFDKIKVRPELQKELEAIRQSQALMNVYLKQGRFLTLFNSDSEIVMIYGMINSGFGTYIPMVLPGSILDKHKFSVVRCIYKYVDTYVGPDVRRFEVTVTVGDDTALKFAKWFGCEIAGLRRQSSCTGEDQLILERLFRK